MPYQKPADEKKNIFIATPLLDPHVSTFHADGLIEMVLETPRKVPNTKFYRRCTFPRDIVRARSRLAREFLESPCTHLLYIDGDNVPNSTALAGMLRARKDVVACPYPRREVYPELRLGDPLSRVRYSYIPIHGATKDIHDCVPIDGIGFGFILIRREVIEKLVAENRWLCSARAIEELDASNLDIATKVELKIALRNVFVDDFPGNDNKPTVALFSLYNTLDGKMLGEDYAFCARCRDQGIKIWMYVGDGSPIEHDGLMRFTGDAKDLIPKVIPAESFTSEDR